VLHPVKELRGLCCPRPSCICCLSACGGAGIDITIDEFCVLAALVASCSRLGVRICRRIRSQPQKIALSTRIDGVHLRVNHPPFSFQPSDVIRFLLFVSPSRPFAQVLVYFSTLLGSKFPPPLSSRFSQSCRDRFVRFYWYRLQKVLAMHQKPKRWVPTQANHTTKSSHRRTPSRMFLYYLDIALSPRTTSSFSVS